MRMTVGARSEPPETMTHAPTLLAARRQQHNKLLILIAAYKLLQALLFAAVGVGAFRLMHQDIDDVLSQIASILRFNPESRFVNFILDKAALLNDPLLRRIGAAAFSYSALSLAEGIGLYLEKAWGEFLTLAITASFLPWEIFELVRHPTSVRAALLIANTLIFIYLVKLISARRNLLSRLAK